MVNAQVIKTLEAFMLDYPYVHRAARTASLRLRPLRANVPADALIFTTQA